MARSIAINNLKFPIRRKVDLSLLKTSKLFSHLVINSSSICLLPLRIKVHDNQCDEVLPPLRDRISLKYQKKRIKVRDSRA